jgi:NitT/TauT family transport system substrate-binding protein
VLQVRSRRRLLASLTLALAAVVIAACGSSSKDASSGSSGGGDTEKSVTLKLGYFPNVTHAPALIAKDKGYFEDELGSNVKIDYKTFNAGSEAVTAILAGALDASFVGPNPAINAFQKTKGEVRIVSGIATGGAFLVVKPGINSAADLKGKKVATPQAGNTQDVALRTWLNDNGVSVTKDSGEVTITPQENSVTLTAFQQGQIDGAWVPEPWATRLVQEGGGKILVDEASLWPDGKYTTTVLLVTKKFLDANPTVVENLIAAANEGIKLVSSDPAAATASVSKGIGDVTGKPLKEELITSSFKSVKFGLDPVISSLETSAKNAEKLGFLESSDIAGIYDSTQVDKVAKT